MDSALFIIIISGIINLSYEITFLGIGGHGGSGRQADWETRFHSIIERLSHFISPSFSSQLTTISSSERLIPPSTAAAMIRNPEEFVDSPGQIDERVRI